jgi:hypothetical protein
VLGFGSEGPSVRSLELILLPSCDRLPDTRPARRFHPAWMYCRVHNRCNEPLFVYGPRHPSDASAMPTSLFLLSPGQSTPKRWDCKGILVPYDRTAVMGRSVVHGPVALKYRDMRRVTVEIDGGRYRCPSSNGVLGPGLIDFTVPLASYQELIRLPSRRVDV